MSTKVCIYCNVDCASKPRIKDEAGRYACRPCFDQRAQAKAASPAAAPARAASSKAAPVAPTVSTYDDEDAALQAAIANAPKVDIATTTCASCGAAMPTTAAVCARDNAPALIAAATSPTSTAPAATPLATCVSARENTVATARRASAPSATRIAISLVRRETVNDSTE